MSDPKPKIFSNGKYHVTVKTVGELIDELSLLPREMKTTQGFSDSTDATIYNRGSHNEHLSFEEGGFWNE